MLEPIRVLQVVGGMGRGGIETTLMNIFRNIDRQKVMFDFVVHTEDRCAFDDEIEELGGRIFRVPAYRGRNHFEYKKSWEALFKEHPEYRIIHGSVRSTASIYLKIAKRYGLVTISHSHSTSNGNGCAAIAKKVFQLPVRHIADYLFACSRPAGEWLFGKKACSRENFYIFNNAVDTEKFIFNDSVRKAKRNEFQISDKFVIGHVGRFYPMKNHAFLIDIFNEVHKRKADAVLLLVGDGPLRGEVEKKVKRLDLSESLIFTGVRSDVPDLLQAMDVFVFPSLYEGLPVTLTEAQASGLPCIISDAITKEAIITDLNSYISLNSPTSNWADRILSHADGYERRNMQKEIVEAGYDIVEAAKWLEDFYIKRSAEFHT